MFEWFLKTEEDIKSGVLLVIILPSDFKAHDLKNWKERQSATVLIIIL